MPTTYKVLGQSNPGTSATTLYTVPSATSTIISSIVVCNTLSSTQTFRIWVSVGGAGLTTSQYIYYDVYIAGNDTFIATVGLTAAATDRLIVSASASGVTFSAYGSEIS